MTLFAEEGGRGPDLLVLLHGLGATAAVWQPLLASASQQWKGRWIALDLPGHGRSAPQAHYAIHDIAAIVARAVAPRVDPAGRIVVLGHSLGGAIGLALASGECGVQPERVFGVGIKVAWSDEDLQRLAAIAAQPRRRFATQQGAWERYLKVSGLAGLVDASSPVLARGIVRQKEGERAGEPEGKPGGWCLAMDPAANDVGRPPFAQLISAARCPVHLARGRQDALVALDHLRSLDPSAEDLGVPGDRTGHNVMVEAPALMWEWFAARR
jgi:pimeloyl-ACP methyl ester carboxylesterase